MRDLSKFQNIIKSSEKNRKKSRDIDAKTIAKYLNLEIVNNENGNYFYKEYNYELHLPGKLSGICFLDEKLYKYNLNKYDLIFLDLETTSLSIGAGNYPFLIGIGYFNKNQFLIRQYLYTDVDSEKSILHDIEDLFKENTIVTYNGKCFDIPLLKNRFILNKIDIDIKKPSMDLLYIMRRLFKYKLDSFDLQTVSDYLSINRNKWEDVEGFEIPGIFNEYIHFGKYKSLKPVLYHNERDVFALAKMLSYIEKELYSDKNFKNKKVLAGVLNYELKTKNYYLIKDIKYKKIKKQKNINYILLKIIYRYYKKCNEWDRAEEILKWSLDIFSNNLYFIKELTKVYYLRKKDYKKAVKLAKKGFFVSSKFGLSKQKQYYKKIMDRYK